MAIKDSDRSLESARDVRDGGAAGRRARRDSRARGGGPRNDRAKDTDFLRMKKISVQIFSDSISCNSVPGDEIILSAISDGGTGTRRIHWSQTG